MSYRIYIGIVKEQDLQNHLAKELSDSDEDYDKKWNFFYDSRQTELIDETPIDQFQRIKGYMDEEYPPYMLSKDDFQTILNFYKKILRDGFEKREKEIEDNPSDKMLLSNISIHYYYLKSYFDRLIKQNKNIDGDGSFLLDYFNLVRMYENMGDADIALITHG